MSSPTKPVLSTVSYRQKVTVFDASAESVRRDRGAGLTCWAIAVIAVRARVNPIPSTVERTSNLLRVSVSRCGTERPGVIISPISLLLSLDYPPVVSHNWLVSTHENLTEYLQLTRVVGLVGCVRS